MSELQKVKELTKDLTLLYVEDDLAVQSQFKVLIENLFDNVLVGSDGVEGLEIFKNNKETIDIVLTDIKMPHMNGIEMSKEIRKISPNIHIVVLTAFNDVEYFSEAIAIGVDGFIIKPILVQQLLSALYKSAVNIKNEKEIAMYHARIKEALDEKRAELENLYIHDRLTRCFNREKLEKDIDGLEDYILVVVNIDDFDGVNSTFGYKIGDELLKSFAIFLRDSFDLPPPIYRIGGDEFVLLFEKTGLEMVEGHISSINKQLKNTQFDIAGCSIQISCTMGIAKNSANPHEYENTLLKAHSAMMETREIGKSRYHIYEEDSPFIAKYKNNIEWMNIIKDALMNDMVIPYFQPIVDNKTLEVVKYESLCRIKDINKTISPTHFIEPAKLVGIMPRVTDVMISKTFSFFSDKSHHFTINISEGDFLTNSLPHLLEHLANRFCIEPNRVTLEFLESIYLHGNREIVEQLDRLKSIGFLLAIDDFGSGDSNFQKLRQIGVSMIKIDGNLIKDVTTNIENKKLVYTLSDLAKNLECISVAEFVHSKEIFECVSELGINCSQGFYFGEPEPYILK